MIRRRKPLPRSGPLRRTKKLRAPSVKARARAMDDRAWSELIRARAGWRCEFPGCPVRETVEVRLQAHHVIQKSVRPDLRHDPMNGRALCGHHHRLVHNYPRTGREIGLLGDSWDTPAGVAERYVHAVTVRRER